MENTVCQYVLELKNGFQSIEIDKIEHTGTGLDQLVAIVNVLEDIDSTRTVKMKEVSCGDDVPLSTGKSCTIAPRWILGFNKLIFL